MVSAVSSPVAANAAQLSSPAPAATSASTSSSAQLAPDTISISASGHQAAATGDVGHDGDSH